jgi:hypothetical protein
MATITFTYQIPKKSIGGFVIDAMPKEHYSFKNTATSIPVEDGSTITDHVIEETPEIQITGFIGKAEFVVFEPSATGVPSADDPKGRIKSAYFELLRLKSARQPVDLVTGLDTYPNMVITEFIIDREAQTGADLPFEMSLKQIKIIKSETTTVNASRPSADQTAGVANMGVAGTTKDDPDGEFMKQAWQYAYKQYGGTAPTKEEYFQKWGEYP